MNRRIQAGDDRFDGFAGLVNFALNGLDDGDDIVIEIEFSRMQFADFLRLLPNPGFFRAPALSLFIFSFPFYFYVRRRFSAF